MSILGEVINGFKIANWVVVVAKKECPNGQITEMRSEFEALQHELLQNVRAYQQYQPVEFNRIGHETKKLLRRIEYLEDIQIRRKGVVLFFNIKHLEACREVKVEVQRQLKQVKRVTARAQNAQIEEAAQLDQAKVAAVGLKKFDNTTVAASTPSDVQSPGASSDDMTWVPIHMPTARIFDTTYSMRADEKFSRPNGSACHSSANAHPSHVQSLDISRSDAEALDAIVSTINNNWGDDSSEDTSGAPLQRVESFYSCMSAVID